jgi:hypothetical protein
MATAKPKKKRELDIGQVLKAVDLRDYDFYDRLSDKERKELSPYVLMRFISNSNGDRDIQEWFIERTNEFVNKNHWSLSNKHDKLLWQLCAAVGPGMTVFHKYLGSPKSQLNKFERLLADIHPTYKEEDIKVMSSVMTSEEKDDLLDSMGFDKKQRKEYE